MPAVLISFSFKYSTAGECSHVRVDMAASQQAC